MKEGCIDRRTERKQPVFSMLAGREGRATRKDNIMTDITTCAPPAVHIGKERLLGVVDVCDITGLSPVTAAKLMRETGRCIRLHRRLYILEASFLI